MTDPLYIAELALADRAYPERCWAWLTEQVQTLDEATQEIRLWPPLDYLHDLVDVLTDPDEHLIAVPKSRRMMVSWVVAAWAHWLARYHSHHAIIWQSETEDKAAFVVDKRVCFIEDHLRHPLLARPYEAIKTSKGQIGKVTWPATGSWILAVPQGADVFRSYTPSVVVMDESEFQQQGHDALGAAMPLAEKGAKVVLMSSSNGPNGPIAQVAKSAGFTRYRR